MYIEFMKPFYGFHPKFSGNSNKIGIVGIPFDSQNDISIKP